MDLVVLLTLQPPVSSLVLSVPQILEVLCSALAYSTNEIDKNSS